jgi:hypothetical protein
MVWNSETTENIHSTFEASGLRAFADKFSDTSDSKLDALLAIHGRVKLWRMQTMKSLQFAIGTGLLRLDEMGRLSSADVALQPSKHRQIVRTQTKSAEKLGAWFASLSLLEIATILHIRF